ncbi:ABC-three component system protein, partial [Pantoea agglomerans]|uniref:ABC-three component system protein n=1 Tax=Enterobacter agglomerans TaxID=549 RepID=UPI003D2D783E
EDDITSFEKELIEEWEIQFENMCDRLAYEEELTEARQRQAGRELFDLLYDTNKVRIRTSFTDHFLANGARHMLADRGELGWHPDFRARLATLLGVDA